MSQLPHVTTSLVPTGFTRTTNSVIMTSARIISKRVGLSISLFLLHSFLLKQSRFLFCVVYQLLKILDSLFPATTEPLTTVSPSVCPSPDIWVCLSAWTRSWCFRAWHSRRMMAAWVPISIRWIHIILRMKMRLALRQIRWTSFNKEVFLDSELNFIVFHFSTSWVRFTWWQRANNTKECSTFSIRSFCLYFFYNNNVLPCCALLLWCPVCMILLLLS